MGRYALQSGVFLPWFGRPWAIAGQEGETGTATDAFTKRFTITGQKGGRLELFATFQEVLTVPQVYSIHKGDTRTLLSVELKQQDAAGTELAVDLTGFTVQFKMVDENGTDVIAQTSTGVTVSNPGAGLVSYDFSSSGVDTAGTFYGYFVITDGGETDHFPVKQRDLVIHIEDD